MFIHATVNKKTSNFVCTITFINFCSVFSDNVKDYIYIYIYIQGVSFFSCTLPHMEA